jgi:hypothetical protein
MHPVGGPFHPISKFVSRLCEVIDEGEAVRLLLRKTAAMRILDYRLTEDNLLVMLVQYSDTNASDPVFSDLETGDLRVEPKLDGEGVAVSSHCALDLDPHDKTAETHLSLVEVVPGLPRWRLENFLNFLLKLAAKRVGHRAENENGRNVLLRPKISMYGHLADDFVESLKAGKAKDIELVSFDAKQDGFDEVPYMQAKSRSLVLETQDALSGNLAVSKIKTLIEKARKKHYDKVRIRVANDEGYRTVSFGTHVNDLAEASYTKTEAISLSTPMAQCEPKLKNEIADGMAAYLREGRSS